MSITSEISNGFHFNNKNPSKILPLTVKVFTFLFPGVVLGHYIDQYINKLKNEKRLGNNLLVYIFIQTVVSVMIVYYLVNFAKSYTKEIESSIAGVFFASLYFNMQTHYIDNIQHYLGIF